MINKILLGIIKLIVSLVTVILTPFDNLIQSALPQLSNGFTAIGNLLNIISSGLGWAISLTGLSYNTMALIVAYWVFTLTAPMLFYMIKLALAWYNRLKP